MRDPKEIKEFKDIIVDRVAVSKDGIVVFNKQDESQKHTEDIQEIITKVPSWIVRWGVTLLFSTILIMVAISVLVPYPEMIKYPLKLQSFGNTISVVADTTGRITKVFVEKNATVRKGQPLIEIQKETNQKSYILKAPGDGRVGFSAIIQAGDIAGMKQEMFKIHPLNEQFFGVMHISKNDISKVRVGQEVLIKFAGTSSAGNNVMRGKIDFVADEPVQDHFLVKVVFTKSDVARDVKINTWMEFEAQVITKKSNLFQKVFGNVISEVMSSKFNL